MQLDLFHLRSRFLIVQQVDDGLFSFTREVSVDRVVLAFDIKIKRLANGLKVAKRLAVGTTHAVNPTPPETCESAFWIEFQRRIQVRAERESESVVVLAIELCRRSCRLLFGPLDEICVQLRLYGLREFDAWFGDHGSEMATKNIGIAAGKLSDGNELIGRSNCEGRGHAAEELRCLHATNFLCRSIGARIWVARRYTCRGALVAWRPPCSYHRRQME